jgi:purine-cytosine permease-like protein
MSDVENGIQPGDQHYRDSIRKIEPYGIEHIPDQERHGKSSSQFYVWFSGNLGLAVLVLGFYPVYYGLSMPMALSAIAVGALLGSIVMGALSRMGNRIGVAQQIQARGPLGYFGNFLPVAYVNVFASIGWTAVNTVFGAWALQALISIPFWLAALVLSLGQFVVAMYGYNMIHAFNKVFTFLAGGIFLLVTIKAFEHADWNLAASPDASYFVSLPGGWITATGIIFSYLVAWFPFASDYSRYLPSDTSTSRSAGIYTAFGNFFSVAWLAGTGALVASFAGSLGAIDAIKQIAGGASTIALVGVVLTTWTANSLNIYGGAISIQTLRVPVSRAIGVAIIAGIALGGAILVQSNIYGNYYNFILLSAYFIIPYATVVILDYYFGGKWDAQRIADLYDKDRAFRPGFFAWIIGVIAAIPFWTSTLYTGMVATDHPEWGDLTYAVAAIATVVAYLVLTRSKSTNKSK